MPNQSKSVNLFCRHGGSDKVYNIYLEPVGDLWLVRATNGRRGGTLANQYPLGQGQTPTSYEEADKVFQTTLKKKAKDYTDDANGNPLTGPIVVNVEGESTSAVLPTRSAAKELSGWYPQLPTAWDEDRILELIADNRYVAQEKFNGEYRGILINECGIQATNKRGEWITVSNEIYQVAKTITNDFCFMVAEDMGARIVIHDILQLNHIDLRNTPCLGRWALLPGLLGKYPNCSFGIAQTTYGTSAKQQMYDDLKAANAEGMVFKNATAIWEPGDSKNVWKVKFYALNCFIVTGVNKQRSVKLGLLDDVTGQMIDMGNCTIPVNKDIPTPGSLLDVRYLYAFPGGKLHQPVYDQPRPDAIAKQCVMSKLKFIREKE